MRQEHDDQANSRADGQVGQARQQRGLGREQAVLDELPAAGERRRVLVDPIVLRDVVEVVVDDVAPPRAEP